MTNIYELDAGLIPGTDGPVFAWDDFCKYGTHAVFDVANAQCWSGGAFSASDTIGNAADLPGIDLLVQSTVPAISSPWIEFAGGAGGPDALRLQRAGATGVPFFPSGDGSYTDLLFILWMETAAFPASNAGIFGFGRSGATFTGPGLQMTSAGVLQDRLVGTTTGITAAVGVPMQVGLHYQFDSGAGTSSVVTYKDGSPVSTLTGPNPTTLVQDASRPRS